MWKIPSVLSRKIQGDGLSLWLRERGPASLLRLRRSPAKPAKEEGRYPWVDTDDPNGDSSDELR
jgi:hypothetical protein